jgi:hypothetical protein
MNARSVLLSFLVSIVLAGCADERSEVRIRLENLGGAAGPDFHVSISDGLFDYDFTLNESDRSAGPFPTRSSGTLKIRITLYADDVITETSGTLDLSLKGDWRWGIDIFIQEEDPTGLCFGCFGSKSYELDPALGYEGNERLYILWGGNSIRNPVEY